MASISITNITKTSASITVTADSSASRIWTLTINGTEHQTSKLSSRKSYTWDITGLKPGTTYKAIGQYGPTTGYEYPSTLSATTKTFTTLSPQILPSGNAKLSEVSKTPTSLKIKVSGITPYSNITRTFSWYLNGYNKSASSADGTETEDEYEFKNLSPSTTYTVEFRYKRTGAEYDTFYVSDTFTTPEAYATSDSASYTPSIKTTSGSILLYNITPRSYVRTARFHWYNTTTGGNGYKDEPIGAYGTSVKHDVNVNANTKYRFKIQILNLDDTVTYDSGYFYCTTWSDTDDAGVMYTVNGNTIRMALSSITPRSYPRWARFQLGETINAVQLKANDTYAEYTYKNLSFNTQYGIKYSIRNDDGSTNGDGGTRTFFISTTATTDAPNYTLTFSTSSTYNSVTAKVTVDTVQSYDLDLTVYLNGERALEIDILAGEKSRERTWETGIVPATAYTVMLEDKIKEETKELTRRTKNNFSWSTNVASGATFNLTAADWNEFTSQLSTKCNFYSLAGTYSFDTAYKGKPFTAAMFNQAVAAINGLVKWNSGDCVTKMDTVSTGDKIYASEINKLASCLNE